MSTGSITPVPTGGWVKLPFYPGCRYVAIPPTSTEDVRKNTYWSLSNSIQFKVATVTFHMSRPESLVYYQYGFHLMDIQV